MTLILKSFICYINCQLFGNVFCGLELVDLCRGCLWLVFSNPVYGCVVCVTCYTQVHTYMLWHVCRLCVRDCKWDSVPFPGFFLILLFSMCLFFYHLHSRLQSLMWFQPAGGFTHAGCYNICLALVPGCTPCRRFVLMSWRKRSPEVMQPDQKRVLKCCLVHLGRARLVVLQSTAVY